MESGDLTFCTTRELINELLSRKTFLGLVLHSEQELKTKHWSGEQVFRLHLNSNLNSDEASRLLDAVAAHIAK